MPAHPHQRPRSFDDDGDLIPDRVFWSPGPILGFRIWSWTKRSVRGPSGFRWRTSHLVAECRSAQVPGLDDGSVPPPHLPGEAGLCLTDCGVYSFKHADKLIYETIEVPWVQRLTAGLPPYGQEMPEGLYGVVSLTGRVIECEEGFRAHRADVIGIVLPDATRIWTTTDLEAIRRLFEHPEEESPDEAWSHVDVVPGAVPITVLHELERIAHGHR